MNINVLVSKGGVADTGCKNVCSYRYGKSANMGTKDAIRHKRLLEGDKTIQYKLTKAQIKGGVRVQGTYFAQSA